VVQPDYADAFNNRGNILVVLKQLEEALASYERALAVRPDFAEAFNNRGNTFKELKRLEEALASYERAIVLKPDHKYALGGLADCTIRLCDWTRDRLSGEVRQRVSEHKSIIAPFTLLGYSDDESLQLLCAKNFIQDQIGVSQKPLWRGTVWRNEKIKVAYVSADFRHHPMAYLMVELFELHDRSRFEVIGVSFGFDDRSEIRARLVAGFDQFVDVRTKSDAEVARLLNGLRVDIAIDLMGHTSDSRPQIFAFRPTPIQVNYLGFPGTTGADFIDYIIADQIVLPFDRQPYYTEKIVHLPDCFQVNDRERRITTRTPTRQEVGLPVDGFVFCCFNNNWKITPTMFDVWMRLLQAVEGSVLWLGSANKDAEMNLCNEARTRGVDPNRLIFAGRTDRLEDHLARHRVADLFLDTLPYNAHTTASDALWAGLPVVTCEGRAYPGRVASSLLHAIGLPELVTSNLADYEALALKLVREPALLAEMKARLARNRDTHPLFDTDRFRRNIEAAYMQMWGTWQRGDQVPGTISGP
jgi:protein O-GlcNAc transferase